MKKPVAKKIREKKTRSAGNFDDAFEVRLENLDKMMRDIEKRMQRFQKISKLAA